MRVTAAEAARILGCSRNHVYRLARQGRLPRTGAPQKWAGYNRETVETYSLQQLGARGPSGHPYWMSVSEAADILGVTPARVRQLARSGRIPALRHTRVWVFRRHQLEVVANARDARKFAGEWG